MPPCRPKPAPPASGSQPTAGPLGPMRGTVLKVVAAIAVIALLAATLLAVWGLFRASQPVAGDPWGQSTPAAADSTTGGVAPSTGATPGTSATAQADTDYPAALADFYTQQVDWKACGDSLKHECATFEVPVDYAKPGGDRFTLAVRKAPATDRAKRLGSLLINPGGPGASGVQYAQLSAFGFTPKVRAAYDIVGFDPRGIGQSSPVRCLRNSDMDRLFSLDPTPDTAGRALDAALGVRRHHGAVRPARRRAGAAPQHDRGGARHGRHAGARSATGSSTSSVAPTARSSGRSTPTPSRRRSVGWCWTQRCRRTRPTSRR